MSKGFKLASHTSSIVDPAMLAIIGPAIAAWQAVAGIAPTDATGNPVSPKAAQWLHVTDCTPTSLGKTSALFGPFNRKKGMEEEVSVKIRQAIPGISVEVSPADGKNIVKFFSVNNMLRQALANPAPAAETKKRGRPRKADATPAPELATVAAADTGTVEEALVGSTALIDGPVVNVNQPFNENDATTQPEFSADEEVSHDSNGTA